MRLLRLLYLLAFVAFVTITILSFLHPEKVGPQICMLHMLQESHVQCTMHTLSSSNSSGLFALGHILKNLKNIE